MLSTQWNSSRHLVVKMKKELLVNHLENNKEDNQELKVVKMINLVNLAKSLNKMAEENKDLLKMVKKSNLERPQDRVARFKKEARHKTLDKVSLSEI
jgi:hypothetical protein